MCEIEFVCATMREKEACVFVCLCVCEIINPCYPLDSFPTVDKL